MAGYSPSASIVHQHGTPQYSPIARYERFAFSLLLGATFYTFSSTLTPYYTAPDHHNGSYRAYNERKDPCPHPTRIGSVSDTHSCRLEREQSVDLQTKESAAAFPEGTVLQRKPGSGAQRKTSHRTHKVLKREVKQQPSITAVELKKNHPELLQNVTVRMIQHRLQKDLGLPC